MPDPEERYTRYTGADGEGPDLGRYIEVVSEDAKAWFEAQKELMMLETSLRIGQASSKALLYVVMGLITSTVLVFWFIALALWLGQVVGDQALGFLAAGGVFLLLGGLFYLVWRTVLKDRVALAVINALHVKEH